MRPPPLGKINHIARESSPSGKRPPINGPTRLPVNSVERYPAIFFKGATAPSAKFQAAPRNGTDTSLCHI
jgi:hypothetical protein